MFKVIVRYNSKDYPEFVLATGTTAESALSNFYQSLGYSGAHFTKCSVILYDVKDYRETVIMNHWND